jgi:hypothetical protein
VAFENLPLALIESEHSADRGVQEKHAAVQ